MRFPKKTTLRAIARLVLLVCFPISSSAIEIVPTPDDIRLRVDEEVGLFWLNEETVLYRSFRNSELELIQKGTFSNPFRIPRILRSYNIRTREFKDLVETGRQAFCVRDDKVLYDKPDNKWPPSYLFGRFGSEKPLERAEGSLSFVRCNVPDISHLAITWPSEVVPLLEEHGFVEIRRKNAGLQERSKDPDLYLYPPSASFGLPIQDIRAANVPSLSWPPIYAAWKGAYFIFKVGVRNFLTNSGWWLFPDGKTEKVDIPLGEWNDSSRTNAFFAPAKCGLIIDNHATRPKAILFLRQIGLTYSDPKRIAIEAYRVWAISPDGRKLAIATGANKIPNTNPSVLRVFELCDA